MLNNEGFDCRVGPLIDRLCFFCFCYHCFIGLILREIYAINRYFIGLYYTGLLNAVERSVHLHG